MTATHNNSVPGSGYGSSYIDSLIAGCGWSGGPITYTFAHGGFVNTDGDKPATGAVWADAEKAAFRAALANFSQVCNVDFQEIPFEDGAQLRSNLVWWKAPADSFKEPDTPAAHQQPQQDPPFDTVPVNGFFNYNGRTSWGNFAPGEQGYLTILHEIAHGMGLAHPHDGGGESDATTFPGVDHEQDSGDFGQNRSIFTVLSYVLSSGLPNDRTKAVGSLMALDIAALQAIYGARASHASNDVYGLPSAEAFWSCIWDTGGIDTISAEGLAGSCVIDLRPAQLTGPNAGGYLSYSQAPEVAPAPVLGGFTIANGVTIENAIGGNNGDKLHGNDVANTLKEEGFRDELWGLGGSDLLFGGTHEDTLHGGEGHDLLDGGSGRDQMFGGPGNEYTPSTRPATRSRKRPTRVMTRSRRSQPSPFRIMSRSSSSPREPHRRRGDRRSARDGQRVAQPHRGRRLSQHPRWS